MAEIGFLPTLMFLLLFSTLSANSPNISTDQSALLALKSHITHDPHNLLATNWSTSTSVCNWIGVTCGSRHRRIIALDLSSMDLTGTIPSQLGNLSFLALLNIRNNSFHGSLPIELTNLHRLRHLNFASCDFSSPELHVESSSEQTQLAVSDVVSSESASSSSTMPLQNSVSHTATEHNDATEQFSTHSNSSHSNSAHSGSGYANDLAHSDAEFQSLPIAGNVSDAEFQSLPTAGNVSPSLPIESTSLVQGVGDEECIQVETGEPRHEECIQSETFEPSPAIADIFTKPLSIGKFEEFRQQLGVRQLAEVEVLMKKGKC
ncbi:hypothetical protein V6N11_061892 [Hibiscus sabdariffa]|uniref:Leucine-rich repeat-containing N-terminal plant-type domain-containing protein n=1 Tax=Hibiscus sabdariffa TaxID=183260 RepID=A0ABR2N7G0_9ROSI